MTRVSRFSDFGRVTFIDGPVLSTDGKLAAWTQVNFDMAADRGNQAIWLHRFSDAETFRFTTGTRALAPSFSPDGTRLLYTANHGNGSRLYLAPLAGGEPRELGAGPGANQVAWSPDGRRLAYVRTMPGETATWNKAPRVITDIYFQVDGAGVDDGSRRALFIYDLDTDEETRVTSGDWHDGSPTWSIDGEWLYFVANRSQDRWNTHRQSAIWRIRPGRKRAQRLTPADGEVMQYVQCDDGTLLYIGLPGDVRGAAHRHILRVDPAMPDRLDTVFANNRLTPGHLGLRGASLASDGAGGALFLAGSRGRTHLFHAQNNEPARARVVVKGDLQITGFAHANGRLTWASLWTDQAAEVHTRELKPRAPTVQISHANTGLMAELSLGETRIVPYQHADGTRLEMFVLLPPGYLSGRRYPLWLNIHGGPHGMHPVLDNPLLYQIQAALGYVVMLPNPRGSVSFGESFMRACQGDWGGGDFEDIMAGVDHLLAEGFVDPARLFVEGYSYGGIMTAWIVGQTTRFKAAVIGAPVVDQVSNFGTDDEPHFSVESMGGTPQQAPDAYRRQSALTHVDKVTTPVQLQHYEGDLRCPIQQSMQFYMALKFLGREVEFVRYPGGSHVGRTPRQWLDMNERIHAWFQRFDPAA